MSHVTVSGVWRARLLCIALLCIATWSVQWSDITNAQTEGRGPRVDYPYLLRPDVCIVRSDRGLRGAPKRSKKTSEPNMGPAWGPRGPHGSPRDPHAPHGSCFPTKNIFPIQSFAFTRREAPDKRERGCNATHIMYLSLLHHV